MNWFLYLSNLQLQISCKSGTIKYSLFFDYQNVWDIAMEKRFLVTL